MDELKDCGVGRRDEEGGSGRCGRGGWGMRPRGGGGGGMIERFGLGFRARRLRLGLWARWSSCARAVGHKCFQHISLFGYLGMLIEVKICTGFGMPRHALISGVETHYANASLVLIFLPLVHDLKPTLNPNPRGTESLPSL